MSGAASARAEQPFVQRRVIIPVLERVFGAAYSDMRRMEALLRGSDLDWVCLRPPQLVSKKATGRYRLDASRPLPQARSITCADLATALLDSFTRPTYTAGPHTSPTNTGHNRRHRREQVALEPDLVRNAGNRMFLTDGRNEPDHPRSFRPDWRLGAVI